MVLDWPADGDSLAEDPIVGIPIRLVAAAGRGLESTPVENRDIAAGVMDQLAPLERARGLGAATRAYAENRGQKFLLHMKFVCVGPILFHHQPAGKPRLHHVKARTGRRII